MSGVANDSQYLKKFNTSIENGNEVITSGNRNFDKKLDGNFGRLTEQLRERSKKKESGFSVAAKKVPPAKKNASTTAAEVIEVIDIDSSSSSDSPSETTGQQKPLAVMNKENNNNKSTASFEKSSSSPPSSSFSVARGTPAPKSRQHFVKNQNPTSSKKKRHSPSPSSLATWICNRCTYENKGVDHLCLMCRNKRT